MVSALLSVFVDVNGVIGKGASPYSLARINQFDGKTEGAFITVNVVVLGCGALKLVVDACEAVIVVSPAPTIVIVLPEIVATLRFELM